jgi:uncharacterized protein (TIGR00255 family)
MACNAANPVDCEIRVDEGLQGSERRMLQSMTGQGHASGVYGQLSIEIEVRTVNNRFLKLTSKLSEMIGSMEPILEGVVRECLRRGTVSLSVRVWQKDQSQAAKVCVETLRSYLQQVLVANSVAGVSLHMELGSVLQLPGVLDSPEWEGGEGLQSAVVDVLRAALEQLNGMRTREGASMEKQLSQALLDIAGVRVQIEARAPGVIDDYRKRLESRMRTALAEHGKSVAEFDLLREVLLHSDRCDIREELVRLDSHLDQFRRSIHDGEAAGKRLDFLIQELFRETNTIGSKANDATISHHVVTIKTIIEQMRELVQNVE